MTISRKIFSATISLPALTPTSLATLMRNSILHWGLEDDLVSPSMDSILGSEASITPEATVFIGVDENVRDVNASPFYRGVSVVAAQNYSLQDFGPVGLIDPNQIWLYNQSGTNLEVVFQAR